MSTERRTDLEQAPFKHPPFLTEEVCPPQPVAVKASNLYYRDVQAEETVQTDRTLGTAPTATTITSSKVAFDMETLGDERIHRKLIPESEVAMLGGLDKAELAASRITKRACLTQMEASTAANVLANASLTPTNILNDMFSAIALAADTVLDYADGLVAMVTSRRVVNIIKRYQEMIDRMKFTGVQVEPVMDVRNIALGQMAAAMGIDKILAGPNAEWYTADSDYQDRVGIMVLPDKNMNPLEEIQFGRTLVLQVSDDPSEWFLVETYHSDDKISDVVQCRLWAEQKVLNVEALNILNGFDPLNASSTTTTTTT